jgi:hypothetical protein
VTRLANWRTHARRHEAQHGSGEPALATDSGGFTGHICHGLASCWAFMLLGRASGDTPGLVWSRDMQTNHGLGDDGIQGDATINKL